MNASVPTTESGQLAWLIKNVQALMKRPVSAGGGGGFDPNANPVVIGLSADGGAVSGAVAIGWFATTAGSSENAVAIGAGSTSSGGDSVAIGNSATATADSSVSIGDSSAAIHVFATALGASASARYDNSTAVGSGSVTTAAHQIMLGTDLEYVEIPGDSSATPNGVVLTDTADGTRYIVQITSGALVLNAAP